MKQIPETNYALVLRTDFSDPIAWEEICATIPEPVGDLHFLAYVEFEEFAEAVDADGVFRGFPET